MASAVDVSCRIFLHRRQQVSLSQVERVKIAVKLVEFFLLGISERLLITKPVDDLVQPCRTVLILLTISGMEPLRLVIAVHLGGEPRQRQHQIAALGGIDVALANLLPQADPAADRKQRQCGRVGYHS